MNAHDIAARIGRQRAQEVLRALQATEEWRLPSSSWEQVGELIDALVTAVDAGDMGTVDEVTAELETCGRRVIPIGAETPPTSDVQRVPPPATLRERIVPLVHAIDAAFSSTKARPAGQHGQDN